MTEVTAIEFAKGIGRYEEEAHGEPIAITSYGRVDDTHGGVDAPETRGG
jgi:hypothetical protein